MDDKQMAASDALSFYALLEGLGIEAWIDGGWGVDALLGRQTREHGDLDLIIQQRDAETIRFLAASRGYRIVPRDDLSELNFHMRDKNGHELDFTVIEFDSQGNGIYGPPENGEMNPADSFKGIGSISGHTVQCVSPEYALSFRLEHELSEKDRLDIKVLCDHFNFEPPKDQEL